MSLPGSTGWTAGAVWWLRSHSPCTQPGIYTIDHTFVDPSLRGQGMADKLVRAALEQIRKNGGTPAATCTYAVSWLEKHPEQA